MLHAPRLRAMVGTARASAAKAFYGELLGFELVSEDMFSLKFDVNGEPLRINKVPAAAPAPYAVLAFEVADIVSNARGLSAKGVMMERFPMLPPDADGIWTAPDGTKVAWFRDPDGNLLSLVQDP